MRGPKANERPPTATTRRQFWIAATATATGVNVVEINSNELVVQRKVSPGQDRQEHRFVTHESAVVVDGRLISNGSRRLTYRFRPEAMLVADPADRVTEALTFSGTVSDVAFIGAGYEYHVEVGDSRLEGIAPCELSTPGVTLEPGTVLDFVVAEKDLLAFEGHGDCDVSADPAPAPSAKRRPASEAAVTR